MLVILDPTQKKPKCAKYWPSKENEIKVFGHMQIKLLDKSPMRDEKDKLIEDIILRNLEVSNGTNGNMFFTNLATND